MKIKRIGVVLITVCLAARIGFVGQAHGGAMERLTPGDLDALAAAVIADGGVRRGLCVVLGCDDGTFPLQLARASDLLIHVQEPDPAAVDRARHLLDEAGLYGRRVIVEKGRLDRLPYADNLADLVTSASLTDEFLDEITPSEILRVLRPKGVAILNHGPFTRRGKGELSRTKLSAWLGGAEALRTGIGQDDRRLFVEMVKPLPIGIDDWSHWQHGPDNNPFSCDRVITAPYMTHFLGLPWFSAIPSISVVSGGRLFRAAGHIAFHDRENRYLNTLYATNAYNGTALWTRPIPTGFLVHRSIFVATPEVLYLMDNRRCLVLDAKTGEEKDTIVVPPDAAGEGCWKWIALDGGVLYVLLGGEEYEAEIVKRHRPIGAWGWNELSRGYYEEKYPWGFGDRIVAMSPQTKEVLWVHTEEKPIDSRALCMSRGRIFLHSEGCFVACLDQETGKPSWRNNAPELLAAISEANDRGLGFKTTPYALATDRAVYFAGRGRKNVVAVSAEDGKFLWSIPGAYNATNLLFQGGHLYAHIPSCKMLEPLTGRIVKDLGIAKRSCARFTGCPDSLFHRGSITGGEGTTRYDLATGTPTVMHAIRPPCMDGHIPAQGFLYRTQWVCDCNLQLIGLISLCPAGDFEFNRQATESERLETSSGDLSAIAAFANSDRDWPTYRADNYRSSSTRTNVPGKVAKRWEFQPGVSFSPSPPTVAGGTIFLGGDDCKVRAIDVQTGKERWTFLTGGAVRMPPSIGNGRAFAGSADGYVYALEAATGRPLWRFRAAPVERKIPVYGSLSSTWPVNSGALVRDGTVYAAAGIVNFDGTHVYALDALTGKIKWQNNTSGYLNEDLREGASVQGDLAVVGEKLLLAGGNVLSPAVYNLSDGKCLNSPPGRGHPAAHRGSEVCGFLGKYAMVGGRRLFTPDDDPITNWQPYDVFYPDNLAAKLTTEFKGRVPPAFGNGVVAFSDRGPLLCLDADKMDEWIRKERPGVKERWKTNSVVNSVSVAVAGNAIVAAGEVGRGARSPSGWSVQAFAIESGDLLWAEPLPRPALPGGLCVDKDGRMIVVLEGGNVLCLGEAESR